MPYLPSRISPGALDREQFKRVGLALAVGAAGGYLFALTGVPLAWMLGSMIFTAAAAIIGLPVRGPKALRSPMVAIIGATLGASFTPALLTGLSGWGLTASALLAASAVATALGYQLLNKVVKLDKATAFFAATPGGLLEMSMMGEERGGEARSIILIHTIRIFCVVLILPPALAWIYGFGQPNSSTNVEEPSLFAPEPFAWFLLCCVAGMYLGRKLRLPAAHLTGPMLMSGFVHLAGWTSFQLPPELVAVAQVVLGAGLGTRFLGIRFRETAVLIAGAIGSMAMHLIAAIGMAVLVAKVSGYDFLQVLLAYSPGGIAEMSLIAIAIGADAAFVAAHHVIRVVVGLAVSPLFFGKMIGNGDP